MLKLTDSVKYLKTVGEQRAKYLSSLGIYTIEDLITYFPRSIQDRRNINSFSTPQMLFPVQKVTLVGKIVVSQVVQTRGTLGIFKVIIETNIPRSPLVSLLWFKKLSRRYDVFSTLKQRFGPEAKDKYVVVYGRTAEVVRRIPEISVEDYEILDNLNEETIHTNRLVPIYTLNENLNQQWFRELMFTTLNKISVQEYLPPKILNEGKFNNLSIAIKNIHFPDTWQLYAESKKRFMFDKFLLLQIAVLRLKKQISKKPKVGKYDLHRTLLTPFKEKLNSIIPNFEFTKSQKKVINELFRDMLSNQAMNRILIGDVGSGKTIVAVSCALLAVENGYQVAFMAPTEILAEQHYYNLTTYVFGLKNPLTNREVKIELYLGKTPQKKKKYILEKVTNGEVDVLIGTQSLIEEKVKFKNLSLVIIDEQHRFGVIQRKKLYEKSVLPDTLIMTATPIPRSLAMTLYGELDISTLDELPPGRIPIKTFFYNDEHETYNFIIERLKCNEKVYIVYPIIEETKLEIKTLVEEYAKLSKTVFKDYPCGLLHGKMKSKEKEDTMLKFKSGEYKILFSTTVIEVGIDIPDATVIVINHSERFGLSQLHQLRGRVGRSDKQSYCILLGTPTTEEAKQRIQIMTETNDGFKIAEEDLMIRGPGDIFGLVQHGKTDLDFSDVIKYNDILMKAKEYAKKIVFTDEFKNVDLTTLYKKLYLNYGRQFDFGNVG